MKQYRIHESKIESLRKKIKTISNKCKKYGCDFHYAEVGEEFKERTDEEGRKIIDKFIVVECEGKAVINDWQFIASVDHTESGNIIRSVVEDEVPQRYYYCNPVCEHCKSNRVRKYTFIVKNTVTGEFKQVGKSCLRDFTFGMDAEFAASLASFFSDMEEEERPAIGGGYGKKYFDLDMYLRYASETVRLFGYSKEGYTTAMRAYDTMCLIEQMGRIGKETEKTLRRDLDGKDFDANSDRAVAEAKAIVEWAKSRDDSTEYLHNLKVACSQKYASFDILSLLASSVVARQKNLAHEAKIEAREAKHQEEVKESEWVGKIGERIEFAVKEAVVLTSYDTDWGLTVIYKIVDENGNVFIWKSGSYTSEVSKWASVKGTIKDHSEYNGVKQTVLTRCKITDKAETEEPHPEYTGEVEKAMDMFFAEMEAV